MLSNVNNIFYISDLHFGHKNIIRYDNRPFFSVEEMDDALIRNWNARVTQNDEVYILGDIGWYNDERLAEIFLNLNGIKTLIKGNHDSISPTLYKSHCFDSYKDYLVIEDKKKRVILSHYPMPFWDGQFRNTIHLYGHVHNSHQWQCIENFRKELAQLQDIPMRMYNVGCMMPYMDYTPRTLDEIISGYEAVNT